jgi:hypothetical protein
LIRLGTLAFGFITTQLLFMRFRRFSYRSFTLSIWNQKELLSNIVYLYLSEECLCSYFTVISTFSSVSCGGPSRAESGCWE